jgi:hypothetical protein
MVAIYAINLTKRYDQTSGRKFAPEFKAKEMWCACWSIALEAVKDQLALAELSKKFEVYAVTISKWQSEFLANLFATFSKVRVNVDAFFDSLLI